MWWWDIDINRKGSKKKISKKLRLPTIKCVIWHTYKFKLIYKKTSKAKTSISPFKKCMVPVLQDWPGPALMIGLVWVGVFEMLTHLKQDQETWLGRYQIPIPLSPYQFPLISIKNTLKQSKTIWNNLKQSQSI